MKRLILQIGYNTASQIIGRMMSAILSLISVGLLTRYLGKKGFGEFSLILAYFSFFGILADLGLQLTMVRELSKSNVNNKIYGTYFYLKLTLVIISTLIAIGAIFLFPYNNFLKLGVMIASLGIGLGLFNNFGSVIFQAKLRLDLLALVDILSKVISVIFIVVFIYFKLGFYSILNTILLGNIAASILTFVLLKKIVSIKPEFDFKLAKRLIYQSLPVCLTSIFILLHFKADTLILSIFRGQSEVGIYSLSYKVIENLLVFWGFYIASVYPLLSNLINKKDIRANKIFKRSILIALISSFTTIIVFFLFSDLVINILGGSSFKDSSRSLKILLFSMPFFFLTNLLYHVFLIKRVLKKLLLAIVSSLVINLILNILFIPKFGFIAASVITVITEVYLLIIYLLILKSFRLVVNKNQP